MAYVELGGENVSDPPFPRSPGGWWSTKYKPDNNVFVGNNQADQTNRLYAVYRIDAYVRYSEDSSEGSIQIAHGRYTNSTSFNGDGQGTASGTTKTQSTYQWIQANFSPFIINSTAEYAVTARPLDEKTDMDQVSGQTTSESFSWASGQSIDDIVPREFGFRIYYYGLPNKVTGLEAYNKSETTVSLRWDLPTSPQGIVPADALPDGVIIEYKKSTEEWDSATKINQNSYTDRTRTITGLTKNTKYDFRVGAYNGIRNLWGGSTEAVGPWSDEVSETPTAPPVLPSFSGSFRNGEVNQDYGTDTVTVSNSTGLQVLSGTSLPTGLTLNTDDPSQAVLSGIPFASGTYTINLRATNSNESPATTKDFTDSFVIDPAPLPEPPVWNTQDYDTIYIGIPYSSQVTAQNATEYYTPQESTLESIGLSLNTSNGTISGTPTNPGFQTLNRVTFTIIASNSDGIAQRDFEVDMRFPGRAFHLSGSTRLTTALRYDGTGWTEIQHAKRYDGSNWVDLEGF